MAHSSSSDLAAIPASQPASAGSGVKSCEHRDAYCPSFPIRGYVDPEGGNDVCEFQRDGKTFCECFVCFEEWRSSLHCCKEGCGIMPWCGCPNFRSGPEAPAPTPPSSEEEDELICGCEGACCYDPISVLYEEGHRKFSPSFHIDKDTYYWANQGNEEESCDYFDEDDEECKCVSCYREWRHLILYDWPSGPTLPSVVAAIPASQPASAGSGDDVCREECCSNDGEARWSGEDSDRGQSPLPRTFSVRFLDGYVPNMEGEDLCMFDENGEDECVCYTCYWEWRSLTDVECPVNYHGETSSEEEEQGFEEDVYGDEEVLPPEMPKRSLLKIFPTVDEVREGLLHVAKQVLPALSGLAAPVEVRVLEQRVEEVTGHEHVHYCSSQVEKGESPGDWSLSLSGETFEEYGWTVSSFSVPEGKQSWSVALRADRLHMFDAVVRKFFLTVPKGDRMGLFVRCQDHGFLVATDYASAATVMAKAVIEAVLLGESDEFVSRLRNRYQLIVEDWSTVGRAGKERVAQAGLLDDLIFRARSAAGVLKDLWDALSVNSRRWYSRCISSLNSMMSNLLTGPVEFIRNCATAIIASFVRVKFRESLARWSTEILVLCKLVVRWAFGFSYSQILLDLAFDASDKILKLFSANVALGAFSQADGADSVLGLVITCLFTYIGLRDLPPGVEASVSQAVKLMSLTTRGSSVLASQFSGSIGYVRDAVMRAIYGDLYRRDELFAQWPATGGAYLSAQALLSIEKPMLCQQMMFKNVLELYHHEWRKMDRDSQAKFSSYLPAINEAARTVQSIHLPRSRKAPAFVLFVGPSGVGKSYLSKVSLELCHNWYVARLRHAGVAEEMIPSKRADFIFTFNPSRSHFDGYRMQLVTQFPELFQMVATTATRDVEVPAFISMASNDDFEPPMAHLESKGIPYISRLIVGQSNTVPWQWGEVLTEVASPLAFQRRITLCISIAPKQAEGAMKDHIIDHQGRDPDEYLNFFSVDPVTGAVRKQMTFVDVVQYMTEALEEDPYQMSDPNLSKIQSKLMAQTRFFGVAGSEEHKAWHREQTDRWGGLLGACSGCECTLETWATAKAKVENRLTLEVIREHVISIGMRWVDIREQYPESCYKLLDKDPDLQDQCVRVLLARAGFRRAPEKVRRGTLQQLLNAIDLGKAEEFCDNFREEKGKRPASFPKAEGVTSWISSFFENDEARDAPDESICQFAAEDSCPEKTMLAMHNPACAQMMNPEFHLQCLAVMQCTSLSKVWKYWRIANHGARLEDIPIWCTPFRILEQARAGQRDLHLVLGKHISMARQLEDTLVNVDLDVIPPKMLISLVERRKKYEEDGIGQVSPPAESDCPAAWFTYRRDGREYFLTLDDFLVGKRLLASPRHAEIGDKYSARLAGEVGVGLTELAIGLAAFGAVLLAGRMIYNQSSCRDRDIWAQSAAESFDPPVLSLSLNDRNMLQFVRASCFLFSFSGEAWTNCFAVSQSEIICAAHSFRKGQDFTLARGEMRWNISFDGGRGYGTQEVDDLIMIRLFNDLLPGCRTHSAKFSSDVPRDAATHPALFVSRWMDGEVAKVSQVPCLSVFQATKLSYSHGAVVRSVPTAWVSDYIDGSGLCGGVLYGPGEVHPLLAMHVAGDGKKSYARAVNAQTLRALSSMCGATIEIQRPDTGFAPYHDEVKRSMQHDGYIVGGIKSAGDTIVGDLVPTPFIDYTNEATGPVKYFRTPVSNTHPDTAFNPDHIGFTKWDDGRRRSESLTVNKSDYVASAYALGRVERGVVGVDAFLAQAGIDPDEVVSVEDSVKGSAYIDHLVRSTSVGKSDAHLGPTKGVAFCEPGDPIRYKRAIVEVLNRKIRNLYQGIAEPVVGGVSRKVEKDKEHKVADGKARLFYVVDGIEICAGRALFYKYLEARRVLGTEIGFALALMPADYHWLHELSLAFSHVLDSDVTGQDVSIDTFHLIAVFAYLLGLGLFGDRTSSGRHRVHPEIPLLDDRGLAMFTYIYRCPLVAYAWFSVLLEFGAGNPSGGLLTWDINVSVNKISYFFIYHGRRGGSLEDAAESFLENAYFIGGGDDALVLLRGDAVGIFGPGWEKEMANVGFVVTDPNNKLMPPQIRPLRKGLGKAGCSFLGRQWIKQEGGNYRGVLELDRIMKIFHYCKKGELFTTFPLTVYDALRELRWHGKELYTKVVSAFPEAARISWKEIQTVPAKDCTYRIASWLQRCGRPQALRMHQVEKDLLERKAAAPRFDRMSRAMAGEVPENFSYRGIKIAAQGAEENEIVAQGAEESFDSSPGSAESSGYANQVQGRVDVNDAAERLVANPSVMQDFAEELDEAGETLKKAFQIKTFSWTPTANVIAFDDPYPSTFLNGNFEAQKVLVNREYLRGTVVVRVRMTAGAFDNGAAYLYATPLSTARPNTDTGQSATGWHLTANHGVVVDANRGKSAEIRIPFVRDVKASEVALYFSGSVEYFDWCRVGLVITKAMGTRVGAIYPTLVVEAWMEEAEIIGFGYNPFTLAAQGKEGRRLQKQTLKTRIVESASGALAEVADVALKVGTTAVVGALMAGLCKPLSEPGVQYVRHESWGGASHINATLPVIKLGDGPAAARVAPPGLFGFGDQTMFERYCSRPMKIDQLLITTSMAAMDFLTPTNRGSGVAVYPVTPWIAVGGYTSVVTDTGTKNMYWLPPCAYAAGFFRYWRGTVVITFRAVKTKFHNGALRIIYSPGGQTTGTRMASAAGNATRLQNFLQYKWDLDERDEVQCKFHFSYPGAMMQRHTYLADGSYPNGVRNGWFGVVVDTPLRTTNEVVSNSCALEMWIHTENNCFAGPSTCITEVWRGPDYIAPGPLGEGFHDSSCCDGEKLMVAGKRYCVECEWALLRVAQRGKKKECGSSSSSLPKAQGGETSLREGSHLSGIESDDRGIWTPIGGESQFMDSSLHAVGAVYSSWRELVKRPGTSVVYASPGASLAFLPDMSAFKKELSTFGWCSGDQVVACYYVPTSSAGSGDTIRQRSLKYTATTFVPNSTTAMPTDGEAQYVPDLLASNLVTVQVQSKGIRLMTPLCNGAQFDYNKWRTGTAGLTIAVSAAGANISPREQWMWGGDNFDMGWQISPPLVTFTSTASVEYAAPMNAASGQY